jgi:hypothetical protein
MTRSALFSALCTLAANVSRSASVTLGGELAYPAAPATWPVYDTVFDPTMAGRVTTKVGAGVEAAKGEVSYFSSAPLPANALLFDSVAQRTAAAAFFNDVLPADSTRRRLGRKLTLVRQEFHRDRFHARTGKQGTVFPIRSLHSHRSARVSGIGTGSFAEMEIAASNVRSVILRWNKALEPHEVDGVPLTPCRLLTELSKRRRSIAWRSTSTGMTARTSIAKRCSSLQSRCRHGQWPD